MENQNQERRYYSIRQASEVYGVKAGTLRRWTETGRLKAVKIGRVLFIPVEEMERLFAEGAK